MPLLLASKSIPGFSKKLASERGGGWGVVGGCRGAGWGDDDTVTQTPRTISSEEPFYSVITVLS